MDAATRSRRTRWGAVMATGGAAIAVIAASLAARSHPIPALPHGPLLPVAPGLYLALQPGPTEADALVVRVFAPPLPAQGSPATFMVKREAVDCANRQITEDPPAVYDAKGAAVNLTNDGANGPIVVGPKPGVAWRFRESEPVGKAICQHDFSGIAPAVPEANAAVAQTSALMAGRSASAPLRSL